MFDPWVGKIPWRKESSFPTPVFWPEEFHGLYSSKRSQRVGHDWATLTLNVVLKNVTWHVQLVHDLVMSNSLWRPVHGILQARILEWIATSSSRGSSNPGVKPRSLASPALARRFFTTVLPGKPILKKKNSILKWQERWHGCDVTLRKKRIHFRSCK